MKVKKKAVSVPKKISMRRVIIIALLVIGFIALLLATYFLSGISVNTIHK